MQHVDPGLGLEQLAREMGARAVPGRAEGEGARFRLGHGDDVADADDVEALAYDQDVRHGGNAGDRGEIPHRVVGAVLDQALVGRVRLVGTEHQRVPVGLGARHRVGADDARSAGTVLDHDRLIELAGAFLRDQARQRVDRSAGRVGHHDGDGSVRKVLRLRGKRECGSSKAGKRGTTSDHGHMPAAVLSFNSTVLDRTVKRRRSDGALARLARGGHGLRRAGGLRK